ncbi:MAG: hypothetical protein GTN84_11130 [Hydrogenophaga sp.]|uniref:hypothetical protein n=1 Tax=Hydrogenophaga sp. TaxID=1904254 RepID=UPI001697624B|nr:hypothetical protein [Hydrogenophaga sp.]NIM41637.1 hypothetical protein [Hydrogenophaga sp.]NIN26942.1 hypothetical protein [Hydrogenophaga sp.]NIN31643.1 hypothetical protein [Hydrogenophaga sp.]NIN55887.1 hypothetical protein [Hydrogenophaga sp.]NIO52014.1 hypothetical protein [Hydrogenophaga sp.]
MNSTVYKQPPMMRAYFVHAFGTAALGVLLPSGQHLVWLHSLMQPVVALIPNALRVTERAPDPVFAQTFIGLSLLIASAILLYCIVAVRGYHTKTFESSTKRWLALTHVWAIVLVILGIAWWMPYLDPISKGRAYFMLNAATSSKGGVLVIMNQLLVGFPLFCFLVLWLGHTCTTARQRADFI